MANSNSKWIPNNDGSVITLTINNNEFYKIYKCQSGNLKIVKKEGKCVINWDQEYKNFKSAKGAVDRYLKNEQVTINVKWIEGVPKEPGNYLVYNQNGFHCKYPIYVYEDGLYCVINCQEEFELKTGPFTHYMSLDDIEKPT